MFYRYKKTLTAVVFCIWSIFLFLIGMTFSYNGTPVITIEKVSELKSKKINEDMKIQSKSEGMLEYIINDLTYTAKKQIIFNLQIKKMTSYNYILTVQDSQNREIPYEQLGYNKENNIISYQIDIQGELQDSDIYILVYPVSEITYIDKKISDKAYGKTQVNIPSVRKSTIDKLK